MLSKVWNDLLLLKEIVGNNELITVPLNWMRDFENLQKSESERILPPKQFGCVSCMMKAVFLILRISTSVTPTRQWQLFQNCHTKVLDSLCCRTSAAQNYQGLLALYTRGHLLPRCIFERPLEGFEASSAACISEVPKSWGCTEAFNTKENSNGSWDLVCFRPHTLWDDAYIPLYV